MPKLEPNVKKRYFKFSKILFFRGNKRERSTMRHDPKFVIGVVTDLQKKFSPYIAVFAWQKKNKEKPLSCAKCQKTASRLRGVNALLLIAD